MATVPPLFDLEFADGDLVVSHGADLAVVTGAEAVQQEIEFRLQTVRGDFTAEPRCGASLETLMGAPNTPETGARMEDLIQEALTHDGFLGPELREVTAVPISRHLLSAFIHVDYEDAQLQQRISLELQEGVLV